MASVAIGPSIGLAGVHDALVWAQRTPNYSRRWGRMGQALLSAGSPNALHGPNALQIITADGIGWAQHCLRRASPMPSDGPNTL